MGETGFRRHDRIGPTPVANAILYVYWNDWALEGDEPAQDLSAEAPYSTIGMQRCTIWRHVGKTVTSPTPND
jgi:hypothetical protein